MNKRSIIPSQIQALLDTINKEEMVFCKQELAPHPLFPHLSRYIEVYKITPDLTTKNTHILYRQVGVDSTGERVTLPLQCPDWYMSDTTWSYLRDPKTFEIIKVPQETLEIVYGDDGHPVLLHNGTPKREWKVTGETTIPVNTHIYLKFLLRNGVPLLSLLGDYLAIFISENIDTLNKTK